MRRGKQDEQDNHHKLHRDDDVVEARGFANAKHEQPGDDDDDGDLFVKDDDYDDNDKARERTAFMARLLCDDVCGLIEQYARIARPCEVLTWPDVLQMCVVLRGVSDPERVEVSRDDRTLYVTEEDAGRLAVLDIGRASVRATVVVGREPEGVRAAADGRWVLVTSEEDNALAIVDAHTLARLSSVSVGKRPRDLAISPDGRTAYVSGEGDASVYRVALPTGAPAARLIELRSEARPMGVALDAPRGRLYVSTGRGGSVAVISVADGKLVTEVAVGARPWGIALTEHGARLVTANGPSADATIVDTESLGVSARVATGRGPWGVVAEP